MKMCPAKYMEKPGLGRAGATVGSPPAITMDPGTAVLLRINGVAAVQPHVWSKCRDPSVSGNTQPQSARVRSAGRASPDPVALLLAWLRKPHPPPRLSAIKGTGTL